ncbi:MAG TPA: hypothetical protein VF633_07890 [Brevundimonas sp.]|jgi:hypothetical protein
MKRYVFTPLIAALTFGAVLPAAAQVTPYPRYGAPGAGAGDFQRYEMERLRQQSQESEALARQQSLQTRLTLMELQARRQPAPPPESPSPVLRSVERERAAREAATAQRQSTVQGVSQIDSWLDRQPR